jgi:uncharacterized protein YdaU (DUF1376 family)
MVLELRWYRSMFRVNRLRRSHISAASDALFVLILSQSWITEKLSPLDSRINSSSESQKAVVNDFSPGSFV